ncbi:MAG: signal recognition particle protein [Holosporaceae bacterium]|nr:signal recognition particle protein [Holosporaceae bacterium]
MFDSLSEKITKAFEKLRKSGILKKEDVDEALREIRIALLEADVSLEVAKKFIADVKERAVGQNVVKSISPEQAVVKIVYDYLIELFGKAAPLELKRKPFKIMLVGLQGAGKTSATGKLAHFFSKKDKKIATFSTDIYRPAAIEQLKLISQKIEGTTFVQSEDRSCEKICREAMESVKDVDVLIADTAGRLHIDEIKMEELQTIQHLIQPDEIYLVVDIMTGQDAINIAKKFSEKLPISGVILTRVDGDARGGVALSMRAITGCEIKFLCTGEHVEDIEYFDATKIADRLLGMGDIVSLVEKAQENFSKEEAEETTLKLQKGNFTLDDMALQLEKMSKLGGLKTIIKMLPGAGQLKDMMENQGVSDKTVARTLAIIKSMTKKERNNYKLLNGSRKKRIATGSGTTVQDINKLIRQYENMIDFFKKIRKMGMGKVIAGMMK